MNLEDIKSGKKLLIEGDEVYLTKTFNFIKSMLEIPELITSEDIKKNNNHIMDEDTCKDLVRAQNHSLKIKLFKYLIKIMKKEEFKVSKEDIEYLISKLAEIYDDIQDPMLMSKITNIITRLDNDKILDIINKMVKYKNSYQESLFFESDFGECTPSLFCELLMINRLTPEFVRKYVEILKENDCYAPGDIVNQIKNYIFTYKLDKLNLSTELINVFMELGENPIDIISSENITQAMIKDILNKPYDLSPLSPSVLEYNREYLKILIKNNPYNIRFKEKYMKDDELFKIALENGLELTFNDYLKYGYLSKISEEEILKFLHKANSNNQVMDQNGVIVKMHLTLEEETELQQRKQVLKLLCDLDDNDLLNERIVNYINSSEMLQFLMEPDFELNDSELNDMIKNILRRPKLVTAVLKSLGMYVANLVEFDLTEEFIEKFYELNYSICANASEKILNSQKLYERAFYVDGKFAKTIIQETIGNGKREFLTKELLSLAFAKGYNPIEAFQTEITDPFFSDDVEKILQNISNPTYKDECKKMISLAGNTIFCYEKDNVLNEQVLNTFGIDFVNEMIKHLIVPGKKVDFSYIIEHNLLQKFKKYYETFKTTDDIREFLFLLESYTEHKDLAEDLMSNGMTEEEKENFSQYVKQKNKIFKINNRSNLASINQLLILSNNYLMMNVDTFGDDKKWYLQSAIISSLFNLSYDDIKKLKGIIDPTKIDLLKNNINSKEMKEKLDQYNSIMNFCLDVLKMQDVNELLGVLERVNGLILEEPEFIKNLRKDVENIYDISKNIYCYELNCTLSKLDDGKRTEYKGVPYIIYDHDSYFLAHVMNAFGRGSKLEDFKKPRFIGKTYICLSAIGEGVEPYKRDELDMNHVCLLFNKIPQNSLISMSNRDMGSRGNLGDLDVSVKHNFAPLKQILETTNRVPNEYVIYREINHVPLYPCAVLVRGSEPSKEELDAAHYLEVPLVKRILVKKVKKSSESNSEEASALFQANGKTTNLDIKLQNLLSGNEKSNIDFMPKKI